MDTKQNPFSVYDFLGYLVPGGLFLYGVVIFQAVLTTPNVDWAVLTSVSLGKVEYYVPFILCAYVLGHCLSFVSSVTVEKYSVWRYGYPSAYLFDVTAQGYLDIDKHVKIRTIYRAIVAILLLPVTLLDCVLGSLLCMHELYARPLDRRLITLLEKKLSAFVSGHGGEYCGAGKTDWFRLAYHHVLEHSEGHRPKLQNYVALYGFLRTATLNAVIAFWAMFVLVLTSTVDRYTLGLIGLIVAAMAFCLFMAFIKFYRRFTLEALMALAILTPNGSQPPR